MENGSYTIQTLTNGVNDLSQSAGLLLDTGSAPAALATQTNILGALEANAEGAAGGLRINVTFKGTSTCIAGAALTPLADVMVDAANPGQVIDHVAGAANVAVGKYLPELRQGAFVAAAAGDEVTVHLYATATIY